MNISMIMIIVFINLILLCIHIKMTPFLLQYWQMARWRRQNYEGKYVLIGYGLILVGHIVLTYFILFGLSRVGFLVDFNPYALFLLIPLMIMALAGWIDDFFGDEQIKGLKGHITALFHKRFTSGMLKLLCGVLCSCCIAYIIANTLQEFLLNSLIIMLSIHVVNLFDVRPSRCFKFFFMNTFILIFFVSQTLWVEQMLPILFACLPIFALDKNRLVMLGDTGSNALGLILGMWIVQIDQVQLQYIYLIGFLILAILAERISFSQVIQHRPFLSKLDQWGVKRSKG